MTIIPDRYHTLENIHLTRGEHDTPEKGMCALEAIAWITGEKFSDHPECVSPVIAAFLRSWNDALPDEDRDRLIKPLLESVIGTRSDEATEQARAWICTDWLVRVQTPAWLRLAGLTAQAELLEGMGEVNPESCPSIMGPLNSIRSDADAARNAVRDAAWDAVREAAWTAARDAVWAAARDAARDAAGAAAWAAVWAAARDAAGDAARASARDAARASARDALDPAKTELQAKVPDLIHRLVTA